MQNQEFEKKVQQQMKELRFPPSDDIWKVVEANIQSKRRRRPIVFFFLFAGLILAGGSIVLWQNQSEDSNIAGNIDQVTKPEKAQEQTLNTGEAPVSSAISITENNIDNKQPQIQKVKNADDDNNTLSPMTKNINSTLKSSQNQYSSTVNKATGAAPLNKKRKSDKLNSTQEIEEKANLELMDLIIFPNATKEKSAGDLGSTKEVVRNDQQKVELVDSSLIDKPASLEPTKISSDDSIIQAVINPTVDPNTTTRDGKKKLWKWGLVAGAGLSDVANKPFKSAAEAAAYSYAPATPINSVAVRQPSALTAGASYSIGAFAEKSVARNWILRIGLSYQYFSNSIKVGVMVDSAILVNRGGMALDKVDAFYTSTGENKYTNKYHYLSLPVSIQWQFAKRFAWENTLIVSGLINTNALHYDGISGSYYEDRNIFNNFQFAGASAIFYSFAKNRVQIGPQFQYSFTNLLKNSEEDSKHLRYIGIKSSFLLGRSK